MSWSAGIEPVSTVRDGAPLPSRIHPHVVVVGSATARPLLQAQRAARTFPHAELIIAAATENLDGVAAQLRTAPFVPLETRLVDAADPEAARHAVDEARLRWERRHKSNLLLARAQAAVGRNPEASVALQAARPKPREAQEPELSHRDQRALEAFARFHEAHRHDITREARAAAAKMPAFAPLLAMQTPEQLDARAALSARLQHEAIFDGRWRPYLDDLRVQGAGYAQLGLAFADWFDILRVFRRSISARLDADESADSSSISHGMALLLDIAMAEIGEAYVQAAERLTDQAHVREHLHAAIVESSADGILSTTPDGVLTAWNPAAARIYGYSAAEALGANISFIVPADRLDELNEIHRRVRAGERVEQRETVRITKDGRRVDVALTISPVLSRDGEVIGMSAVTRDITASKRASEEIRARDARHSAMLRAAIDAIITFDHRGKILDFNPAAERLFKWDRDQAIGQPVADVLSSDAVRSQHGGLHRYFEAGDGSELGRRVVLPAMSRDGAPLSIEVSIVQLADREPAVFTGFIRDITALKAAEERLAKMVADLKRSNEELEQFAYVASHDLQEPLRMVASYTELLARRYRGQLDERADKYIHYATDGAKRMQRLIADLLSMSRVGTQGKPFERVDLNIVVGEVQRILNRRIAETKAELIVATLPVVSADGSQLAQVLQNLMANALDFAGDAPPRVRIEAKRGDGPWWTISVHDEGIGFDQEHESRIFQMFQRLQARTEKAGSGIGLALVKKIVERHGGRVWAEGRNAAGGASFHFTIRDGSDTD